jgi:hypothetical protein
MLLNGNKLQRRKQFAKSICKKSSNVSCTLRKHQVRNDYEKDSQHFENKIILNLVLLTVKLIYERWGNIYKSSEMNTLGWNFNCSQ